MTILKAFGQRTKEILDMTRALATCADLANTYVNDTVNGCSQADFDLLLAARYAEDAARDLRQLHAKIQAMRGESEAPAQIPVYTVGH